MQQLFPTSYNQPFSGMSMNMNINMNKSGRPLEPGQPVEPRQLGQPVDIHLDMKLAQPVDVMIEKVIDGQS